MIPRVFFQEMRVWDEIVINLSMNYEKYKQIYYRLFKI